MSHFSRVGLGRTSTRRRIAAARLTVAAVAPFALLAGAIVASVPAHADVGDCNPTSTSIAFSPSTVPFGQGTTLSWNVVVPDSCGMVYELVGPTYETFDQIVGASGSISVPATMLGFGENTWSLFSRIPNSDLSWHLADPKVMVTLPDAAPEGTQVTISDDSAASRVAFVSSVMAKNATVRIAGNVNLNLSNLENIPVAAGVQILGDRSVVRTGPRLFTTTVPKVLLKIGDNSDNVRISGIRLAGGQTDDPFSGVGRRDSDGIGVYASRGVEIDHNELYHWRGAAVNVHDGNNANNSTYLGRLNQDTVEDNTNNVWVHDNYIHHNQHPSAETCIDGGGHAGGYGVEAADGAYLKIDRNVFDWNRHSIAGDGKSGTGYVARDNLILPNGGVHFRCIEPGNTLWMLAVNPFAAVTYIIAQALDGGSIYHTHAIDMHAVGNCHNGIFVGELNQFGDHNCGQAGEYTNLEYNTILYTAGNGIHLRGTPVRASSSPLSAKVGMDVKNNVFAHSVRDGGYITPGAWLQNESGLHDLGNTLGLNTFNNRRSCDFDADGTPDPFIATGVTMWYGSSARGGRWTFLDRSTKRVDEVSLSDVNGDGMCDVVTGPAVNPTTVDSLSLGRRSGTAAPGGSATTQVNFSPYLGPRGSVALTTADLPPGVTASFSPSTVSANSPISTLTLTDTAGTAGTYPVTVRAGASAQPIVFRLTLQDFSLSVSPVAGNVTQGGSVTTEVRLNGINGFTGPVNLSTLGLPSGTTATFNPATVSAAHPTSTLTLTTSASTPGGGQLVPISGMTPGSTTERTATYELTVGLGYAIEISLQNATVPPAGSTTTEVTLIPHAGAPQTAFLSTKNLPDGVIVEFSQPTVTSQEPMATVTITADKTLGLGTYDFDIRAGAFSFPYQLSVSDDGGGNI